MVHRAGCPILKKKTIGFAVVLGIPVVVIDLAIAGPAGLIGIVLGGGIAAAVVRWRRGRDITEPRERNAGSPDA